MSRSLVASLLIIFAAIGSYVAAMAAADVVEEVTHAEVADALADYPWADVAVDGLAVSLSGEAPDEANRFAALTAAGTVIDAARISDTMTTKASPAPAAPPFSVEVLRNDDGISLIGLVPAESDTAAIAETARRVSGGTRVSDLLEGAEYPAPKGWNAALDFGLEALAVLPRAKVSIEPGRVRVSAVAASPEEKRAVETRLKRMAPDSVALSLDVSAPRPVISPFTLRFVVDAEGVRFDACSADTEASRDAILAAAREAGFEGSALCPLGLGAPSSRWGEAAAHGIAALAELGGGTLTYSNADVSLIAAEDTAADLFDRVVGELEADLPAVFALTAVRPVVEEEQEVDPADPEFVATLSPEGQLQLRGRLADELSRNAVESFAAAAFGAEATRGAARIDPDLPSGWTTRVLAALASLAELENGVALVTPDTIDISGFTGKQTAQADIARLLADRLGDGASYALDVTYSEALDPLAALPTPEECVEMINTAMADAKITFAPSSTDIEPEAQPTIDRIAEILRDCPEVPMEIGGHTDSQGRETMNQQLSQARADAVLTAIMDRRVLTTNLTAKGYGETEPIADNGTEAGREANRRIEFRLITNDETDTAEAATATDPANETAAEGADE